MFKIILYCSIFLTTLPLHCMDNKPVKQKKKGRVPRVMKFAKTSIHHDKTKKKSAASPSSTISPDNIVIAQPITIDPLFNHDILDVLTFYICKINKIKIKNVCKSIIRLSWANRTLYHYYSNDKTIKRMINLLAKHHNRSDFYVATILNRPVRQKMSRLISAIKENDAPTKDDLQDQWYLNATFATQNEWLKKFVPHQTLLLLAVSKFNVEGVKNLLNAGAPYNHDRCPNPIATLAIPIFQYETPTDQTNKNAILKLLLEAKINPDSRCAITMPTHLHTAIKNKDKERARLLLEYGANPYIFYFNDCYNDVFNYNNGEITEWQHPPFQDFKKIAHELPLNSEYREFDNSKEPWKQNAFHFVISYSKSEQETPGGWLKIMYDEVQEKKNSHS